MQRLLMLPIFNTQFYHGLALKVGILYNLKNDPNLYLKNLLGMHLAVLDAITFETAEF